MMGSIFASLFGCAHRRLTRPVTPVSKPGIPSGETYVVCLDCGKQFAYDWNHMRIGKPIERSSDAGVLHPETQEASKSKIKYALLGSALPLAILVGSGLVKRRAKTRALSQNVTGALDTTADLDREVDLPRGGPAACFRVGELVNHIKKSGRSYIIGGEVDCAFADHPKPRSLDYWLRENFARNKDIRQVTNEVIAQLVATGLFEQSNGLRCPDSGHKCAGLDLKPHTS